MFQEEEEVGDRAREGNLPPLTRLASEHGFDTMDLFPPNWQGCRSVEILGSRFLRPQTSKH